MLLLCSLATGQTLVHVVEENDAMAPQKPESDRWYTQSMQLSVARWEEESAWELGIEQHIYTPWGIALQRIRPLERPYAGLLLVHGAAARQRGARQDSLRLDLGVVGPASMAGWGQAQVHRALPLAENSGAWQLQLDNELLVNLRADTSWQASGTWWSLSGGLGGAAGKLWTQADAGLALELGRPTCAPPHSVRRWRLDQAAQPGIALLLAADGWLSLWDISLDGNTHGDSHSIPKEPLAGELRTGLVFAWGRWSGDYSYVLRSREFVGQRTIQRYGSASLRLAF